jgi:ubiquinone/menaquinone biosynthesis C-methylase UbiE
VEAAELCSRISLKQIDAKNLPYQDAAFDVVVSNSIVHHIPSPIEVIAEAIRVTRPDGLLFWRDLLRPCDEAAVRQLVELYAGRENDQQKKLFEDSLRAALCLEEIRELVASLGFDPLEVRVTSDRHWTWLARKRGGSASRKISS